MKSEERTVSPVQKGSPLDALARMQPGSGFDLLRGVRVLDLTTSIAGPFATMLLADFGAEVIKVERPGSGDDARSWGPPFLDGESLWFLSVNRNKRSLTLDYSVPAGASILRDLIGACDVVIVNQPARVARKLGLDASSLRALKADLIHVSITGFGSEGARADWTCYDLIAEGYSGVMDLTGTADRPAQKVGAPAADMLAGQDAALAALAALFDRNRSGKGRSIDISLVESMARFLTCRIVPYLGSGHAPTRSGGTDSVIAIYQSFDTADEPITLALGNDNLWKKFWHAVGRPEVAGNPNYGSNTLRRERRAEILAQIQSILLTRKRDEWLGLLRSERIPAGPINRVDQVVADEELVRRGLFYRLEQNGRRIPQVGTAIHIDGASNTPRNAPPLLGEHTASVLGELLGYSHERLVGFKAAGII